MTDRAVDGERFYERIATTFATERRGPQRGCSHGLQSTAGLVRTFFAWPFKFLEAVPIWFLEVSSRSRITRGEGIAPAVRLRGRPENRRVIFAWRASASVPLALNKWQPVVRVEKTSPGDLRMAVGSALSPTLKQNAAGSAVECFQRQ